MNYNLITVLGPTASGKTKIAARLAEELSGEIISADSRQVYKGMDIGTGKDLEHFTERNISYHLVDICEISDEYNLFRFKEDFNATFAKILKKNKTPILVGGTGLYISAVLQNYFLPPIADNEGFVRLNKLKKNELLKILLSLNPKLHNNTDLIHKERIIRAILIEKSRSETMENRSNVVSLNIGIKPDLTIIKKNITSRLKSRLESGMVEEVESLLEKGVSIKKLYLFGLEYRYITQYIIGEISYNDMFQKLNSAIHKFAKRQNTWFRKMEKEGIKINWYDGKDYNEILSFIRTELDE